VPEEEEEIEYHLHSPSLSEEERHSLRDDLSKKIDAATQNLMKRDEEDFKITRDEFTHDMGIGLSLSFIKAMEKYHPHAFQSELYGSWVQKEPSKKIPVCAESTHEKHMIMNRLCTAWCHQPTLSLSQLVSMQFSSMTEIWQAGDYDFIKAIESIRSLDHPKCQYQLKMDRAIVKALRHTLEKLNESIDAIDDALNMFAQEERED
jgi:hypothetical protein